MLKNGTPASPATARDSSVLPVPGGPTSSTPRGMRAPRAANLSGYFRNSTTSASSCLASSTPATSTNVTVGLLPRNMRARLLPKLSAWLFVPCAWRIMNSSRPPKMMSGRKEPSRPSQLPHWLGAWNSSDTWLSWMPRSCRSCRTLVRSPAQEVLVPSGDLTVILLALIRTVSLLPFLASLSTV